MSTLKQIRENRKKHSEYIKSQPYTHPSNISLLAKIIKKQNIILINKICDIKNVSRSERKEILDNFVKINYYCPEVTKYQKKEHEQKNYL